jgi:autoinducer 2-binding periplasmic protein LuxP
MHQVEAYYVGFDRARARAATEELLGRHARLDFIYAASTDIALGALDTIAQAGRTEVLVNGWGGGANELEALTAGRLAVTVMRLNDDASVATADAILLHAAGRAAEVPAVYSGDFAVATPQTPAAELKALEARAFRYSGVSP